jgi:hypothetical protein
MARLLDIAPEASLRPDPCFTEDLRRLIGDAVGRPDRIDYGG